MVRAGVVTHPAEWNHFGYNEIQIFNGGITQGRKKTAAKESYQLRETQIPYGDDLGAKKIKIAPENVYFWIELLKIK